MKTLLFKHERQSSLSLFCLGAWVCLAAPACSSSGGGASASDAGPGRGSGDGAATDQLVPGSDDGTSPASGDATAGGNDAAGGAADGSGSGHDAGVADSAFAADGGFPAGWLFTSGNQIYVSGGAGSAGTTWMGRGVNTDDIFLCGYDNTLWMTNPDQTVETIVSGLVTGWKPTFIRISLAMDSYGTVVSWLNNPSKYATPMTNVIKAIGAHAGVHVLVTLRSDASMIGQDTADGDPEATGLPSDSTTTPNATMFPTGTDPVYVALVDAFATSGFVLFGLTNEPGGNKLTNTKIAAAMNHAVGVIRAEEDRLGVPHHIVSVQGNNWTSDISFYAATPPLIAHDNVVYEVHGYPPATNSYTYSTIPVILGEYGSLTSGTSAAFYADLETKHIPNLAWDFDPYSNCAPDLVSVTTSATTLTPTSWGSIVQSYLLAH